MELNDPLVTFYKDSGAGIIVLNNPDNANVLNPTVLQELHHILDNFQGDQEIRFILIRSQGNIFCHGMDLDALLSDTGKNPEILKQAVSDYAHLLQRIDAFPLPIIALVQGSVKAGGVGLVAACDIVLASTQASFELSEILWGLLPCNVMPYLIARRLSYKQAQYLALTGTVLNADQAQSWGLVEQVHPQEEMEKAMKTLGRQLCRTAPGTAARYKEFAATLEKKDLKEMGEYAIKETLVLLKEERIQKAISNFRAGETPPWFTRFKPNHPLV